MSSLILILCAGQRKRWTAHTPKQCVDVGGIPLIRRTVEQAKKIWHATTPVGMVTIDNAAWLTCNGSPVAASIFPLQPAYFRYVCGTLISTMHTWVYYERIVVLLGDVVYSPELLQCIHDDTLPQQVRFYGSEGERWAMHWSSGFSGSMVELLVKSINAIWTSDALDKLATPYRILAGHPLRDGYKRSDSIYKLWDHDYVDDFDTVEEYEKWLKKNPSVR